MNKQTATLHKVKVDGHNAIFRIDAPAVASALTRTWNSMQESRSSSQPVLTSQDVSDALVKRVCTALHSTSGLTFARNEQNKWFVQAILRDCQVGSAVSDTNTDTVGNHECHRCKGTGTVPSSRDNGTCYRCKGKGYTTVIDRNRNAKYAAHRKARVNAMRNGNAQA